MTYINTGDLLVPWHGKIGALRTLIRQAYTVLHNIEKSFTEFKGYPNGFWIKHLSLLKTTIKS